MLLLVLLIMGVLVLGLLLLMTWVKNEKQHLVTYIVTPPSLGEAPDGEMEIFRLIHRLLSEYGRGHPFSPTPAISLEVRASGNGISFFVSCPLALGPVIKNYLISYWPRLTIAKLRDGPLYDLDSESLVRIHQWRVVESAEGSPMEHLLAGMQGLDKNETVALQLIISPFRIELIPLIGKLFLSIPLITFKFMTKLIGYALLDTEEQRRKARNAKVVSSSSNDDLFSATIRSLVVATNDKRAKNLDMSLSAAIKSCGLIKKQSGVYRLDQFLERRHYSPSAVSAQDMGRLYYFPAPKSKALAVERSQSTLLESPVSAVSGGKVEIVLGMNDFNSKLTPIGLSRQARNRHLMILGATGMGKSTLLGYSIVQDILAGRSLGLIDPHGDLALEVLRYIPQKRMEDVVFIDPADISHPVGINLLELPSGLNSDELEMAKDLVTEAVVSVFRKVFSEDGSGGHRIEYILRNVIHTAFYVPHANLFTLSKLLSNDIYRASIVSSIEDNSLRDFWYGEFNKAGSYQRVKMIAGVTAKLGRFQRSVVARRILEQEKSTIDFEEILNQRKILVCNFSKGSIGEDTSSLLGMVVLAKLQLAAWHRSLKAQSTRKPFYLYVDEFQSFASHTLTQLVSESRKYGICLTLAEQTTANQNASDANILLSNIGNLICFRLTAPTDTDRLLHLFAPELTVRDFSDLNSFHFFMKQLDVSQPLSGETILLKDKGSGTMARRAINGSKKRYGRHYAVEKGDEPATKRVERIPVKRP